MRSNHTYHKENRHTYLLRHLETRRVKGWKMGVVRWMQVRLLIQRLRIHYLEYRLHGMTYSRDYFMRLSSKGGRDA